MVRPVHDALVLPGPPRGRAGVPVTATLRRAVHLTPEHIADALELPLPTPEQSLVISAPVEPVAVIAGAGSGKTETMAARVVWLVANGHARPEEVLGLTFTRKAARELAGRIRKRLAQLRARGLVDELSLDGEANVATYDSYAQRVVAEHAVRLGREPNPRLLSPTVAWQYAQRVVTSYAGPMDVHDSAPTTVLDDVLSLHNQMSGHLVTAEQIRAHHQRITDRLTSLAPAARATGGVYKQTKDLLVSLQERLQILPIVEEFGLARAARETVDFADLSELAARIAVECPEVRVAERERYRVVLLDEYQDTSHSQLVMLRGLFGDGHAVTAVGDPFQAIYSFRGASAGTLVRFGAQFRRSDGSVASTQSLSTSFRNRPSILRVANALTGALRTGDGEVTVQALQANEAEWDPGLVQVGLYPSAEVEADAIADGIDQLWRHDPAVKTVAVLMRKRRGMETIAAALRARNLPVEVVGLGGLLYVPAVADVVATLRVIADPSRGDAMMRLLTGSRWRLGARDVAALGRHARNLARAARADGVANVDRADAVTLVDAVDDVARVGGLSPAGRDRVSRLAAELRTLRARAGAPLPDLVAEVVRTLRLDIEVAAGTGDVATARVDLDAFTQVVADFAQDADDTRVTTFLAYLEAAEENEDGLEPGTAELSEDRIQIVTVHGAKGLEWDAVFVAGMADKVFPSTVGNAKWTTNEGQLPYVLRGDADSLPELDFSGAVDHVDARDAINAFDEVCKVHNLLEETRLAYVALTRARRVLVCTSSRWDGGRKPRGISSFLEIAREQVLAIQADGLPADLLAWCDDEQLDEVAPTPPSAVRDSRWPYDGMAARRAQVEAGAAVVRVARARLADDAETLPFELPDLLEAPTPEVSDAVADAGLEWSGDVDLLLAELATRSATRDVVVELPEHLSVSQLVELSRDPQALARRLRRPMPHEPDVLARRGTAFHAWLEQRFGQPALLDVTELPGSADDGSVGDHRLPQLQQAFLESDWAQRRPVEVEPAFELVLDDIVIRGRVDAVFDDDDDDGDGVEVVDWKTGVPPAPGPAERAASVQLAAYRLAFAHLLGLPLERVSAAFHYVAHGLTRRPTDLLDRDGLLGLVRSVEAAATAPPRPATRRAQR
jgi:DNA helicase-2/ATP-dependent DNA helicase PcrA